MRKWARCQGLCQACAVQKQKSGRKRHTKVVSGPIFSSCIRMCLASAAIIWTDNRGFFAATVTVVHVVLNFAHLSLQKSLISLPHALSLSHRHPRRNPPHGPPFLPHNRLFFHAGFLARSPLTATLVSPHTRRLSHAGTPSRTPSEASQPPLMRPHVSTHLAAQHASEGLLRGFPEVFQSNLQNLSHPLCRNGSRGMPAAKKGGF